MFGLGRWLWVLSEGEYGCQGSVGDEDEEYEGQVEHGVFVEAEGIFAAYFVSVADLAMELDHFS